MSTTYDFLSDHRLSKTQKIIGAILDRHTRRGHDCWLGTEKLAELAHCSKSAVTLALRAFRKLGIVRVIRNYRLRSRRAIVLLWRLATGGPGLPVAEGGLSAKSAPESSEEIALSPGGPPHTPPVEGPDGAVGVVVSGDGPPPHPPQVTPIGPRPDPDPAAEPETLPEPALAEAARVFGPDVAPRVRQAARTHAPDWVVRAIGRAAALRERGREVTWGYVCHLLRAWVDEGGPPSLPLAPIPAVSPAERRAREVRESVQALYRPGGALYHTLADGATAGGGESPYGAD
jgi:hypothetical protein